MSSASTLNTALIFSGVRTSCGVPSQSTLRSCIITMRSQYLATMPRSWDTITTVSPCSRDSFCTRFRTSNCMQTSRCRVGSSMRIISGDCAKALAIITLWRSPPLSSLM